MLTILRLGYLIFNYSLYCISYCVLLQMAQIILFMASVALYNPHITANRHRYNAADFKCLCIMKMQQGMTMLIWDKNYVIMSKLNTNNRPRNMFTPCLHSSDAWNDLGNTLHKFSQVYFHIPSIHKEVQSLCHMETYQVVSRSCSCPCQA